MIQRDSFPDVLRGFALLGIALVNIPLLAIDPVSHVEGADLTDFSNASAAFIVIALFQAKIYLLFSFFLAIRPTTFSKTPSKTVVGGLVDQSG
jgi:uncharacterized membrane protein YeiB